MYCTNCGKEVKGKFCTVCGAKASDFEEQGTVIQDSSQMNNDEKVQTVMKDFNQNGYYSQPQPQSQLQPQIPPQAEYWHGNSNTYNNGNGSFQEQYNNLLSENIYLRQKLAENSKNEPITMWGYFGYMILFTIPLIGQIIAIIMAFTATNINVRNYARSYFCMLIISVVLTILIISSIGTSSLIYSML